MVRRYFSIGEAERLLPKISGTVKTAQRLKRRIEAYGAVTKKLMTDGTEEYAVLESEILDTEYTALKERFYACVEKVDALGAVLRDVDQGVVDFYARFEGRDIFLCWHLGERRIAHWHEEDEGFAGRKRILEIK